ncbi:unnamed protein product [Brassica rapa subsp. trilocularis]
MDGPNIPAHPNKRQKSKTLKKRREIHFRRREKLLSLIFRVSDREQAGVQKLTKSVNLRVSRLRCQR